MPDRSRRDLLRGGLTLASAALVAGCDMPFRSAPSPAPTRRIGVMLAATRNDSAASIGAFLGVLRERGWVSGSNLTVEWREAQGQPGRYGSHVAELLKAGVELIAVQTTGMVEVARAATKSLPIVTFALPADPVGLGWAESLAHPGRNITGTVLAPGLDAKRVELLKDLAPGLTRIGIIWSGRPDPSALNGFGATEAAARALGLTPISLEVPRPETDLNSAFAEVTRQGVEGIIVYPSAALNFRAAQITERVKMARLPAVYPQRGYVTTGGLMSYGPAFLDYYRRTARYVDEILRGANAGDLPIEQPGVYEVVLNLRVAQSLGLTIPQAVLQQVTDMVE